MRKNVLFLFLSILISAMIYPNDGYSNNDTLAIPWRENFESITVANTFPYGMTCTYNRSPTYKSVLTYLSEQTGTYYQKPRSGNKFAAFYEASGCDDWIFSPKLFLRAGTEYKFSFWYITSGKGNGWSFEAKAGFAPTRESMTTRVGDSILNPTNTSYQKFEGSFIPNKNDYYYFGIHGKYISGSVYYLCIDDLEVSTEPVTCKAINLFAKNITNSSIEFYTATKPFNNNATLKYRTKGTSQWNFINFGNQESHTISGLTANTDYETLLGIKCTADTLWSDTLKVKTSVTPTIPTDPGGEFPIYQDFSSLSNLTHWKMMNDSISTSIRNYSKWYIDSTGSITGKKSAFISSDMGKTNSYSKTYQSNAYLYTDFFLFPEAEEFLLSFDWRAMGSGNSITVPTDYLRVLLNETRSFNFTISTPTTAGRITSGYDLLLNPDWKTETFILPSTHSNTIKNLIFIWKNTNSASFGNPSAAIANVVFKPISCAAPKDLTVKKVSTKSITLSCSTMVSNTNISFDIAYKEKDAADGAWLIKGGLVKMDSLTVDGLKANTFYDLKVRKRYGNDTSFWTSEIQAKTGLPLTQPGLKEDFENSSSTNRMLVNDLTNKWIVGNAEGNTGKSIYISSNNGTSNQYDDNSLSISHFYYDLDFAQAESFRLSFDWKGIGQVSDFMRVSLVDLTTIPVEGQLLPDENRLFEKDFYNRRTWLREEIIFNSSYKGSQKRLVFTWKNLGKGNGTQPPIAIDNLHFEAMNCAEPKPIIVGSNVSEITLMSQKLETGNTFVVNYRKADGFDDAPWYNQIIATNTFNGDKFSIHSLDSNTVYELKVRKLCGNDTSFFSSVLTARTTQTPASLSLYENFEGITASQWVMLNEGQTNHWVIGSATSNLAGTKSLYISNTGSSNTYDPSKRSVVHFYRDVKFSEAKGYELRFDWKGGNENSALSVYIVDNQQFIKAGSINSKGAIMDGIKYSGSTQWKSETVTLPYPEQLSNSTKTLVFTWECNGNGDEQAPFAIDNIELHATNCVFPTDLKWVSFPKSDISDKLEIQFTSTEANNNFIVSCSNLNDEYNKVNTAVNNTKPTITGLKTNADYEVKVKGICALGDTSLWSMALKIRMPQKLDSLPFLENFENSNKTSLWTLVNGNEANRWFFGTAIFDPTEGNQAVYIDSLDGKTNACKEAKSIVHLYRDINFPASDFDFPLLFKWHEKSTRIGATGSNYTFLKVSVVDINVVPEAGKKVESICTPSYSSENIFTYESPVEWQTALLTIPKNQIQGQQKRLVFSWENSNMYLPQPPVAIDNIELAYPECKIPHNLRYKFLSPTSVQLNWSCEYDAGNKFFIEYKNGNTIQSVEVLKDTSVILENLVSNTDYEISLINNCGGKYNRSIQTKFKTLQKTASLTYEEKFDSPIENGDWTTVDVANNVNKWITGNIDFRSEGVDITSAAYVSPDDGKSNNYNAPDNSIRNTEIIHIYRDIFMDNTDEVALSFDWRAMGNSNYDYMRVYWADTSIIPVANVLVDGKYDIFSPDSVRFVFQRTWKTEYFSLKGTKNTRKRLIFSWRNSLVLPTSPAAAFSNLRVEAINCPTPLNLSLVKCPTANSAIVTWSNVGNSYLLRYRVHNEYNTKWDTLPTINGRNLDTLASLQPNNTAYEVQVKNNCTGNAAWAPILIFNTPQNPIADFPYTEGFSEEENRKQWSIINGTQLNAWMIDSALYAEGKGHFSAYISNNGFDNTYSIVNPDKSIVHLYRDIEVPAGQKEFQLSFDWKSLGEVDKDYMQVYVIHKDSVPKAGKALLAASLLTTKKFQAYNHDWKHEVITINVSGSILKEGINRLVFTWTNDDKNGEQNPIAIDNISLDISKCSSPASSSVSTTGIGKDTAALKWTAPSVSWDNFNLKYRKKGMDKSDWMYETSYKASFTFNSLEANRTYEVYVQTKCSDNTKSVWIPYTIQTQPNAYSLPVYENFESDTAWKGWTFANGEMTNAWFFDSATVGSGSTKSAYISKDGGISYLYAEKSPSAVRSHFYKDITFTNGAKEYQLVFDWMNAGNTSDYLQVYLINTTTPVAAGTALTGGNITDKLVGSTGLVWSSLNLLLPDTLQGKTKRLVFSWVNGTGTPNQNPAAIDNVSLIPLDCKTPTDLKVVDYPDVHSAVIEWKSEGNNFTITYGKATDPQPWPEIKNITDKCVTLRGLDSNTIYYVMVKNDCGGKVIWSSPLAIRTLISPVTLPYLETFEQDSKTADKWITINGDAKNGWYIGKNATTKGGEQSMYVSANSGDSNYYVNSICTTHVYRDILFPENGFFELTFDWKCLGLQWLDYFQVSLVDIIIDPVSGKAVSDAPIGKYAAGAGTVFVPDWQSSSIWLPSNELRGKRKRLVFSWMNRHTLAWNPSAAIDNVALNIYACENAQNVKPEMLSDRKAKVKWSGFEATAYTVSYKKKDEFSWTQFDVKATQDSAIIENLTPNTTYDFGVTLHCASGFGKITTDTLMLPMSIPYLEDFTTFAGNAQQPAQAIPPAKWLRYSALLSAIGDTINLNTITAKGNWTAGNFANVPSASKAARLPITGTRKDWLVSPLIYIAPDSKPILEFNIGLTFYDRFEGKPDPSGYDDKFMVLISTNDNAWSVNDAIAKWDNAGLNRSFNNIGYTRQGDKIRISLEKYSGFVRLALYAESTVVNAYNDLFIDSISLRPFVCEPIANIHITDIGLDAATIRWDAADEDQYCWQVKCNKLSNGAPIDTKTLIEKYKLPLNNLEMNTEYNVSVRSVCSDKDTATWVSKMFTTLSTCAGVPSGFDVVKTDTSADLTWLQEPTHEQWEIRYGPASQTREQMQRIFVSSPSYTIKGLQELTAYAFYVRAICFAKDTGNWTEKQLFTTSKTLCPAIWSLKTENISVNTAAISWQASERQSQWEIRYGTSGTTIENMKPVFSNAKTSTLTPLLQKTGYDIYVRGICRAEDSSIWSSKLTLTTKECSQASALRVEKNDAQQTVLHWSAGEGHSSWIVYFFEQLNNTEAGHSTTTNNFLVIDYSSLGLNAQKEYMASVQAYCDGAASEYMSDKISLKVSDIATIGKGKEVKVILAPNPAKDFAKLSIENAKGIVTVQVYSLKGEILITEKLNCQEGFLKELTLSGLAKGSYIIRLTNEKWTKTEKLIVQ